MGDSIVSGNFSVRCYLPFIRKDSIIHMYGLAVYVKDSLRILTHVFDWLNSTE